MDCVAGGVQGDALGGTVDSFQYLLTQSTGFLQLAKRYDWVKCNKDFNGYYITDYGNQLFNSFENVLLNRPDVSSNYLNYNLANRDFY